LVLIQNSQSDPISAEGEVEGKISEGERGNKGFGYDPVFIPKGSLLHMAEIEESEKNLISHRANAFRSLIKKLPRGFAKE
jgi:XTP/dITP diphosphohydrolase